MKHASHLEILVSGIGGSLSILTVFALTQYIELGMQTPLLLIASMGASAVLLFAAPHTLLSQPWNVIGGHVVSALIGTFIYQQMANPVVGGAVAVGLAIIAMYYLRCLHPPGGATALIPFIGGPAIDSLGYNFVLFPVGTGAVIMVLIAVIFNYPLKYRRYPVAFLANKVEIAPASHVATSYPDISHADLVVALSEIDTYVDISEEDLVKIYNIALHRSGAKGDSKQET